MRENADRPRLITWPLALLVACAFALLAVPAAGAAEDGKQLFVSFKCSNCHSLLAEGIEVSGDEEEAEEEDPFADPFGDEEEAEPGDLSGLGATWKHDGVKGLMDFLMKDLEIDGELHKKKFKGTKKELKTLSDWLLSLTEPAPAE